LVRITGCPIGSYPFQDAGRGVAAHAALLDDESTVPHVSSTRLGTGIDRRAVMPAVTWNRFDIADGAALICSAAPCSARRRARSWPTPGTRMSGEAIGDLLAPDNLGCSQ